MAKGRTNHPIKILVHPNLLSTPRVAELVAQGHDVQPMPIEWVDRLVIGENCWRMHPALMKYLDLAMKSWRAAVKVRRLTKEASDVGE